jgi:hypothetical protein
MTHNETMRHLRAAVAGNYAIPTGTRHEHYPVTPLFQDVIASIELLESQNRQLVMRLDEVLGTPCEQVRCQQEIERLREERDTLARMVNRVAELEAALKEDK